MCQRFASRFITAATLITLSSGAWTLGEVRGELVRYSFNGHFIQPVFSGTGTPPTDNNVFGVHFPFEAPLSGTFSFDRTSDGVVPFAGTMDFKQFIQGGFAFNVFNSIDGPGVLRLVANAYAIRVTNDYVPSGAPVASDLLSVEFNTLADPSLPSIMKNGLSYTRKPVLITAPLSWDWSTFNDPDEPKLRVELPHQDFYPFQGSMTAQGTATFVINSFLRISLLDGDYNMDGKVDGNDYPEWCKSVGKTPPDSLYADGNHDGVINAADYVIWRRSTGLNVGGTGSSLAPEPSLIVLTAIGLPILAGWSRRRFLCC
jgi:hypothetical protein